MATTARLVTVVDTKGARQAKQELTEFGRAANDADSKNAKLGRTAITVGKGIAGMGVAVGVAATALTAIAVSSANSNRELGILARQARETTTDFRALAFATQQYGVSGEQIADISKDVADRVGEFAAAGTGVFQDYVDVMGLTESQAQATAERFQFMSGREVLGEMVSQMEGAGVTASQMTFVLESMGNDASRLIPLLSENGKELNTLTDRYSKATKAIQLTAAEQSGLQDLAETTGILKEQSELAAQSLSAAFAPVLNSMLGTIIENVPKATNAVVDFFNTFQDAENINSIRSINQLIDEQKQSIEELEQSTSRSDTTRLQNLREARARLQDLEKQQQALLDQQAEQQRLNSVSAGSLTTPTVTGIQGVVTPDGEIDRSAIESLRERYATEEQLALSSHLERLRMLDEFRTQEGMLTQEGLELQKSIYEEYNQDLADIDQQRQSERLAGLQNTLSAASGLMSSSNRELFAIGKAAALANAAIDAPATIMKYSAQMGLPGTVIGTAVVGAQLASIMSATPPTAREQGGSLYAGQATAIAEREPEIFIPKTSGTVKKLDDMAGGGQPIDLSVVINMAADGTPTVEANASKVDGAFVRNVNAVLNSAVSNPNSDFNKRMRSRRG